MTWIPHWKEAPLDWLAARIKHWIIRRFARRNT